MTAEQATPHRLVLWDVDTQRDFMEPEGALYVPNAAALVPNLGVLTDVAARNPAVVRVASVCEHTDADPEISTTPDFRRTFPPHCLRGTRGQEKIPATSLRHPVVIENRDYDVDELARLLPRSGVEILIKKHAFDVFTNPATELVIGLLRPDPVVIYGVALDVCVDRAIVGLVAAGLPVWFVEDASAAIDVAAGRRCLQAWRRLGVRFTTTQAVAARFSRGRG